MDLVLNGWIPGTLRLLHWQSDALTTRLDLIHPKHQRVRPSPFWNFSSSFRHTADGDRVPQTSALRRGRASPEGDPHLLPVAAAVAEPAEPAGDQPAAPQPVGGRRRLGGRPAWPQQFRSEAKFPKKLKPTLSFSEVFSIRRLFFSWILFAIYNRWTKVLDLIGFKQRWKGYDPSDSPPFLLAVVAIPWNLRS